jgi:hypothetical protein
MEMQYRLVLATYMHSLTFSSIRVLREYFFVANTFQIKPFHKGLAIQAEYCGSITKAPEVNPVQG